MKKNKQISKQNTFTDFLLYTTSNGKVKVEIFLRDENIWLTQDKIAILFGVQRPAITKHLKNIFESHELDENSVSSILEHTAADEKTYNIDVNKLEDAITNKTRVIIPVHLYGQSADMDAIMEIAKKHNLKVIEDGAQAIGVQYKDGRFVGGIGDIGCFSFFPSKNLGGFGDAGIVTTNDEKLYAKMKMMRMHGMEPKYYHKIIGGNFRIDTLQAAVLRVKLPHLDSWSAKRRENAALYTKYFLEAGLAGTEGKTCFDEKNKVLLPKAVYKETGHKNFHIYNQYIIRVEKRNSLLEFLRKKEIGCEVYYPVPFHRQECFAYLNTNDEDYPVANCAANDSLALPIYPELSNEQIKYVVDSIAEFMKEEMKYPMECKHCDCMK